MNWRLIQSRGKLINSKPNVLERREDLSRKLCSLINIRPKCLKVKRISAHVLKELVKVASLVYWRKKGASQIVRSRIRRVHLHS